MYNHSSIFKDSNDTILLNLKKIFIWFFLTLLIQCLYTFYLAPKFLQVTNAVALFDLKPVFEYNSFITIVNSYLPVPLRYYVMLYGIDFIYPLIYGRLCYLLLESTTFVNNIKSLPLITIFFDYLENICILLIITSTISVTHPTHIFLCIITSLKFISLISILSILSISFIIKYSQILNLKK